MMHWAERYVGRAYREGEYDCVHLVVDVLAEQFGRRITTPAHARGIRARDAQIAHYREHVVSSVDAPAEGDVVLMRELGRRRSMGHHIGVWCDAGGAAVLHCSVSLGTCLHPLRRLHQYGLEVTGIYRWL